MEGARDVDTVVTASHHSSSAPRRLVSFQQFTRMLDDSCPRQLRTSGGSAAKSLSSTAGRDSRKMSKGVTFRDDDDNSGDSSGRRGRTPQFSPFRCPDALRLSLRRLATATAPGTDQAQYPADAAARAAPALGGSAGPSVRDKLRRALHVAAEARGAGTGRGGQIATVVDKETIRRAMMACGVPLDAHTLVGLERHFDRSGSGDIVVEVRVQKLCNVCGLNS